MPEYYKTVHSLSELLGDKGLLRLPENLHELYVFDKKRQESINVAIDTLKKGEKNVLIVGKAGTGKTAFMFMVLRKLIEDEGYSIGVIYDGVDFLMTEHVENNVILFYDDLPTMKESALQSILKNNVHNIICTSREEELRKIRKIFGRHLEQMFEVIKIERMTPECIEKIFDKYINFEGILVKGDYEVIKKKIVEKSEGLPIYIGQLVRELKISNKPLDNNFAAKIPTGMYKYVEDILYRVLDDDPDAFSILTVLRIMADLKKGIIHQNLYDHLFLVVKKFNDKQDYGLTQVLEIPTFIKFTRYLFRVPQKFAYRFPHDSWSDVVRGKASGAMAVHISRLTSTISAKKRRQLLLEAAKSAYNIVIESGDNELIDAFMENLQMNLSDEEIKQITEGVSVVKPPLQRVMLLYRSPDGNDKSVELPIGESLLYRDSKSAEVVLEHEGKIQKLGLYDVSISRKHKPLIFEFDGSILKLTNGGMSNPIYVNESELKKQQTITLTNGDEIKMGWNTILKIKFS